jgi:hypothetical protein
LPAFLHFLERVAEKMKSRRIIARKNAGMERVRAACRIFTGL